VYAASTSGASTAAAVVFIVIGAIAYFIPVTVAWFRQVPNIGSVLVVNFFFGWTFVGWIIALAMAARSRTLPVTVTPPAAVNRGDGL
jgi:hypothetical protein